MFNLLLSDCSCPRVLSFLPDRVTGLLKIRISEHPYSYCDQLGALLGFPENRSPAFWTKVECHSSTAICSTRISFGEALSEPDLLSRIECLNTESASRTALAFEAVAHGDANGVASNCYLELSATACGFAIWHVISLDREPQLASVRERLPQDARREPPKSLQKSTKCLHHESLSMESIGKRRYLSSAARKNRTSRRRGQWVKSIPKADRPRQ